MVATAFKVSLRASSILNSPVASPALQMARAIFAASKGTVAPLRLRIAKIRWWSKSLIMTIFLFSIHSTKAISLY
jgi:hypothetical protein